MTIVCDRCGMEMSADTHVDSKIIDGTEVFRTYLKCGNCGSKYTAYYDDKKTIELKDSIRRLSIKTSVSQPVLNYDSNVSTMYNKRKRLEHMSCRLRRKYAKYFE